MRSSRKSGGLLAVLVHSLYQADSRDDRIEHAYRAW
jgi:hypothetical protein